jgi:hypothetical protein
MSICVAIDAGCGVAKGEQGSGSSRPNQRRTAHESLHKVDIPKFLKQLDELIKIGRIRVCRGHTDRVYLSYFDERYRD